MKEIPYEVRLLRAIQKAKRFGMELTRMSAAGTYRMKKNEGRNYTTIHGMVAVEQFLRGVEFVNDKGTLTLGPGRWQDD